MMKTINCSKCEFNEFVRCNVDFCILPHCIKEVNKRAEKRRTDKADRTAETVCNGVSETSQIESDTSST